MSEGCSEENEESYQDVESNGWRKDGVWGKVVHLVYWMAIAFLLWKVAQLSGR